MENGKTSMLDEHGQPWLAAPFRCPRKAAMMCKARVLSGFGTCHPHPIPISEVKEKLLVATQWKTLENHWPSWFSLFLHYFKHLKTDLWGTRGCTNPGIGNSHQPPGWLIFGTERCGKILGNIWDLAKWSICTCSLIPANPTSNKHI